MTYDLVDWDELARKMREVVRARYIARVIRQAAIKIALEGEEAVDQIERDFRRILQKKEM